MKDGWICSQEHHHKYYLTALVCGFVSDSFRMLRKPVVYPPLPPRVLTDSDYE